MEDHINNSPILITGSHRSGSTWLGKMLALSSEVTYIHEPFNPKSSVCESNFDYWFTYINKENEHLYKQSLNGCINLSYPFTNELKAVGSIKDLGRIFRDKWLFLQSKLKKQRPLLKDPISIFSADWLYEEYDMDVIVLIRHPAAFVGSLKKAGWNFPFNHFIEQPLLIKNHLSEYENIISEYAKEEPNIIEQGILLWNIIHKRIYGTYKDQYNGDWIFIRHEDLSREPLKKFEKLYQRLSLDFSESVKTRILKFTSVEQEKKSKLKRDSQSNIWSWKDRLTEKEINKIKEQTLEVSQNFYSEVDW
jgi:hypothetical protein